MEIIQRGELKSFRATHEGHGRALHRRHLNTAGGRGERGKGEGGRGGEKGKGGGGERGREKEGCEGGVVLSATLKPGSGHHRDVHVSSHARE